MLFAILLARCCSKKLGDSALTESYPFFSIEGSHASFFIAFKFATMARTRMIRANHSPPAAATAATTSTKLDAPVKMGEYPGWNLDLRWVDQDDTKEREAIYPMGTHHNCNGNKSAMLLVREVAMMMIMDRLSDKPNWHVKVFDDTIAEKWRQEALAWPEDDLWERIANIDEGTRDHPGWWPKQPENILDKECVDYVSEPIPIFIS